MSSNTAGASSTLATTTPRSCRSKIQETPKHTENLNPNIQNPPNSNSPSSSAKKSQKPKNPNSPRNKIRQRKFVVAKKKSKKEDQKEGGDAVSTAPFCNCKEKNKKCVCVAYHNLRKSQEEFFKNRDHDDEEEEEVEEVAEIDSVVVEKQDGLNLVVKRSRERLREEVRESVTQIGSGKVMNLVKAFEKLQFEPNSKDEDKKVEEEKETRENDKVSGCSSFSPSDLILTSQNLGLDPHDSVSSSWDSARGRFDYD